MEFIRNIYKLGKDFLTTEKGELNIGGKFLKIVLVIFIVKLAIRVINRAIDTALKKRKLHLFEVDRKKAMTISTVLKNIIKYILYFIAAMMILDMFNINTSSVLATAGIGGLAIGFGAQSLVKDIITGFFILFEDQFSVGDHVEVYNCEGIVEELGVRVTKVRAFSGELYIIPNSNISFVTNKTKGPMRARVVATIAYEEDIDRAIKVLERVCLDMRKRELEIVEGPYVLGVNDLGPSGIDIMIEAMTNPLKQVTIQRDMLKLVKEELQKEAIEIPYQKVTLIDDNNQLNNSEEGLM